MQFINENLNFEYLKTKFSVLLKQILTGSGNIGVFIILSIIVVATFESLGLSNREKNLEHRLIQNMDLSIESFDKSYLQDSQASIKTELKSINNNNNYVLTEKLKMDSQKDLENKNLERNKILFTGAIEQYLYENKENFPNSENVAIEDKIRRFYNFVFRSNVKSCSDKKKNSDSQFFDI
jgi:hypothetical protein